MENVVKVRCGSCWTSREGQVVRVIDVRKDECGDLLEVVVRFVVSGNEVALEAGVFLGRWIPWGAEGAGQS